MRASLRRKRKLSSDINVVPYIDIMLVLLVVFMVTAPLFSQGYNVDLPAVDARPINLQRDTQIVISITEQGEYYYNAGRRNEALTLEQIQNRLGELDKETIEVFIRGAAAVDYGRVLALMSFLQGAGIENVGLVTQPPRT